MHQLSKLPGGKEIALPTGRGRRTPAQDKLQHISNEWLIAHAADHIDDLVECLQLRTRAQVYYLFAVRGLRKRLCGKRGRKRQPFPPVPVVPCRGCHTAQPHQVAHCQRLVESNKRLPCERVIDLEDYQQYYPASDTGTNNT